MTSRSTPVRFGVLSLLLLVVAIVLALLSVLSLTTANAASSLTQRHAEYVTNAYELDDEGADWLAETDEILQEAKESSDPAEYLQTHLTRNAQILGNAISVKLGQSDSLQLDIVLTVDEDYRYSVESWKVSREFPESDSTGVLWQP